MKKQEQHRPLSTMTVQPYINICIIHKVKTYELIILNSLISLRNVIRSHMVIGSGQMTRNRRLRIAHRLDRRACVFIRAYDEYGGHRTPINIFHSCIETYMIHVPLCNGTHWWTAVLIAPVTHFKYKLYEREHRL